MFFVPEEWRELVGEHSETAIRAKRRKRGKCKVPRFCLAMTIFALLTVTDKFKLPSYHVGCRRSVAFGPSEGMRARKSVRCARTPISLFKLAHLLPSATPYSLSALPERESPSFYLSFLV